MSIDENAFMVEFEDDNGDPVILKSFYKTINNIPYQPIWPNSWNHVTFTYDGEKAKLFMNKQTVFKGEDNSHPETIYRVITFRVNVRLTPHN